MLGYRARRWRVSSSGHSEGEMFLRNLTLAASSAVIYICFSFMIVFCVKYF